MERTREKTCIGIFGLAAVLWISGFGSAAERFGFEGVSGNNPANVQIGETQPQPSVNLVRYDADKVEFLFKNAGPNPAMVAAVYFNASNPSLISPPVEFDAGVLELSPNARSATPKRNSTYAAAFIAGAVNPIPFNGVGSGQQLGVVLLGDYDSVVDAVSNGRTQVGLHVQGMGQDENREGLVTEANVVPAPGALALAAIGLVGAGQLRKRNRL